MKTPICLMMLAGAVVAGEVDKNFETPPPAAIAELEKQFANPPAACAPGIFWYWMNGYVTESGIDADLKAMKEAGIGTVMIFDICHTPINGNQAMEPVKVLSPEWRKLRKQAMKTAKDLGLKVNLYNSMEGWSSTGGPGITPELGMQKLTWSELKVDGGKPFEGVLPKPRFNFNTYSDIAVLAFPTPEAEQQPDPLPVITSNVPEFDPRKLSNDPIPSTGFASYCFDHTQSRMDTAMLKATAEKRHILLTYAKPFAACSLRLYPAFRTPWLPPVLATGELQRSEEGATWQAVRSFTLEGYHPLDITFSAAPARFWRVVLSGESDLPLDELKLSDDYRIEHWTKKALFNYLGLQGIAKIAKPEHPVSKSAMIRKDCIVDLSANMNASGHLTWTVPPGSWTIVRYGYTPTGSEVRPAGSGAQGLECDKLSTKALDAHWKQALGPWLDDPETRALFDYVHIDSYEAGAQNWTGMMPDEFKKRNGYDLKPYLPVLTGRVVDSELDAERFLWDFRQTVCGLMDENYYDHFKKLCHAAGKQFTLEPYGTGSFNSMKAGAASDVPMCEEASYFGIKLAASPAHVYGKPVVDAEAFTDCVQDKGVMWKTAFWNIKNWADKFFCGGVNHITCHVYAAQPFSDAVKPGLTLNGAGTHFHRGNTWWPEMPAFSAYLSRCSYLLQQGRFAADVLFFYGEGAPKDRNFDTYHAADEYKLPKGYDSDVCDADVIMNRLTVRDGLLTTPDGLSYRLLVVPNEAAALTPELTRRLGELISAGATVMAPKPLLSPSLRGQPEADASVSKLAEAIWGRCDGSQAKENVYGKGKVLWGRTLRETLKQMEVRPAIESSVLTGDHGGMDGFIWIQRRLADGDLFFIASPSDETTLADFSFRTKGTTPHWLDPVTGKTRLLPDFKKCAERVTVKLSFAPRQSGFVFFPDKPVTGPLPKGNRAEYETILTLDGSWDVSFDPKWGGPEQIVFERLQDWSKHPDERIRYYSGRATYTKTFNLPDVSPDQKYFLDLGKVQNLANIQLNEEKLGTVWCAPWHTEIKPKKGENQLVITVVNLWPNRLIGDQKMAGGLQGDSSTIPKWAGGTVPRPDSQFTYAYGNLFKTDSPLLESGLLGPVTIQVEAFTTQQTKPSP